MSQITGKVILAFILGAAAGGLGGYYVSKNALVKKYNEDIDTMDNFYKGTIEDLRNQLNELRGDIDEEFQEELSEVPIDPIDRDISPDTEFVDYSSITSDYWGDAETETSTQEDQQSSVEEKEIKKVKETEPKNEVKKSAKKRRHKVPVEAITDEEYNDFCMNDDYKIKQYYLDGDIWTRLNCDDYKEDISIDDFPIPLSDFKWNKSGVAYFVNHEAKQLYKFHNEMAY